MADLNHQISLGVGSPAAIPEFLTFGLQIGIVPTLSVPGLEYTLPASRMHYTMPESRIHYTIEEED